MSQSILNLFIALETLNDRNRRKNKHLLRKTTSFKQHYFKLQLLKAVLYMHTSIWYNLTVILQLRGSTSLKLTDLDKWLVKFIFSRSINTFHPVVKRWAPGYFPLYISTVSANTSQNPGPHREYQKRKKKGRKNLVLIFKYYSHFKNETCLELERWLSG